MTKKTKVKKKKRPDLKAEIDAINAMGDEQKCGKCGTKMTIASFEILNVIQADFGHNLFVGPRKTFYINPSRRSQVNVYVCKKCGYMELYADEPSGL